VAFINNCISAVNWDLYLFSSLVNLGVEGTTRLNKNYMFLNKKLLDSDSPFDRFE